jgi:pectate lyase
MPTPVGNSRALPKVVTAAVVLATGLVVLPDTTPALAAVTADGFASVTALGQQGTTGGAGVTATTTAQFLDYIARPEPLVVQVKGTITLPTGTTDGMHNIIIRNLALTGATDDLINVQMFSHHIWIDDDNGAQDIGRLRVTYHHNYFDGTAQRHPRIRFAEPVHIYNNYYAGTPLYGVASTMDAGVVVEGNYFENVAHPILSGYDKSGPGRVVERNNIYVNSGTPQTLGTVVEPRAYYACTLDSPANVKALVAHGAGVGRI